MSGTLGSERLWATLKTHEEGLSARDCLRPDLLLNTCYLIHMHACMQATSSGTPSGLTSRAWTATTPPPAASCQVGKQQQQEGSNGSS